MVNEFNKSNNVTQIAKLLRVLDSDFLRSHDSQKKKGGLIALASAGIGLGKVWYKYRIHTITDGSYSSKDDLKLEKKFATWA